MINIDTRTLYLRNLGDPESICYPIIIKFCYPIISLNIFIDPIYLVVLLSLNRGGKKVEEGSIYL